MKRKAREEVLRRALEGGLIDDLFDKSTKAVLVPDPKADTKEVAARVRSLFGDRDPRSPMNAQRLILRRCADLLTEQGHPYATMRTELFDGYPPQMTASWVRRNVRWPSEVEAEREKERREKRERRRKHAKGMSR